MLIPEFQLTLAEVAQETEVVLNRWLTLPSNPSPEKRGGYLSVTDYIGRIQGPTLVGIVEGDKMEKYQQFSQEKVERLQERNWENSSWESRCPEENKWGGAARVYYCADAYQRWIVFSFSGLPELADEALMLAVAVRLGIMDEKDARYIAGISSNPLFEEMNFPMD